MEGQPKRGYQTNTAQYKGNCKSNERQSRLETSHINLIIIHVSKQKNGDLKVCKRVLLVCSSIAKIFNAML